jgi:hypothetical protein
MGRAAVASQPPRSWCQRGGGRVNWTDPGGTGVFLTTPRAGDRAGISIYHEQHCKGLRRDRCPHVRAGQIPQGLRTPGRQSRRNNAEYPVRYGSHGYQNELGLATDQAVRVRRAHRRPVTERYNAADRLMRVTGQVRDRSEAGGRDRWRAGLRPESSTWKVLASTTMDR